MVYSEKVIDHYEKFRNVGSLDSTSDHVGTGLVGAPECGDVMKLQIEVNDEGKISDARFKTFGFLEVVLLLFLGVSLLSGYVVKQLMRIHGTQEH